MVSRVTLEKVVRRRWRGELGERNVRAALAAYEVTGP
jgi:Pyruvate/2-oxoacid:ferredoxin oxidoreductase gamma subunit